MKKFIGFLSIVAAIVLTSCAEKPAEVKKEVIIVPAAPVVVVKQVPAKSTTVVLDKNGVKVETKKVDIVVKKP